MARRSDRNWRLDNGHNCADLHGTNESPRAFLMMIDKEVLAREIERSLSRVALRLAEALLQAGHEEIDRLQASVDAIRTILSATK